MPEEITYLEIDDIGKLREPARPPAVDHAIELVHDPRLNRSLYEEIGGPHRWIDRLGWSDEAWRAWAEGVETWIVRVGSKPAGYLELKPAQGSTLISIFGVRSEHRGQGLGGALLTHAIHRGLELSDRVWLSTNTMDGAHALANYEARGMRVFKREALR